MADVTTAQVLQSISEESTLEDSLIALKDALQQQLNDILSGTTLPPQVQADINAMFDSVEAGKTKLAAAVVTNTPLASKHK